MERFGFRHYFGDATRPDLLAAAGIAEAKLLVVAINDRDQISKLVQYVRRAYPGLPIVARAVDRDHVYDLWAFGCRNIIRETYDASLRMGWSALEELGHDRDRARDAAAIYDRLDREVMIQVAEAHKVGIAPHENPEYVRLVRELRAEWDKAVRAETETVLRGDTGKTGPKA